MRALKTIPAVGVIILVMHALKRGQVEEINCVLGLITHT